MKKKKHNKPSLTVTTSYITSADANEKPIHMGIWPNISHLQQGREEIDTKMTFISLEG